MKIGAWEIDGSVLDLFLFYIKSEKKHIFRIPPGKCGLYHTGSHATLSEVYLLLLESSFILEVSGLHIPGSSTSDIATCDYKILPSSDCLSLDFISSPSFITTSFFCSTPTWFLRKSTWRKSFLSSVSLQARLNI